MNLNTEILRLFIQKFFTKKQRKRKSSNNEASIITYRINRIFKYYSNKPMQFEEEEVLNALEKSGFTTMDNSDSIHPVYGKISSSSITQYANVDTSLLRDFNNAVRKTFPENWNSGTQDRICTLKTELQSFFDDIKTNN